MAQLSHRWKENRASLLDIDRAESAFALLFSFVMDGQYDEDEPFDAVLRELLRGLSVPNGGREKLERIYRSIREEPRDLSNLLALVMRDFGDDPELLVSLVRLMLRLSADEGLLSRRHIADLRESIRVFGLSTESFEICDSEETQLLSFVFLGEQQKSQQFGCAARELRQHYDTLGCEMGASDEELRRAYRRLAKRYHPDSAYVDQVHSCGGTTTEGTNSDKRKLRLRERARLFQEIQHAYDAVRRSRS